jgi:hypothetical protein
MSALGRQPHTNRRSGLYDRIIEPNRLRSARVISAGQTFVQNLHSGHYELATDIDPWHQIPHAFTELTLAI